MDIGMLWFDDDSRRPLSEKVARAVEHYKTKYRTVPTVCFVNPATLNGGPEMAAGVQLREARHVLVNHFWIGVGDTAAATNGRGNGKAAGRRGESRRGESRGGESRRGPGRRATQTNGRRPAD